MGLNLYKPCSDWCSKRKQLFSSAGRFYFYWNVPDIFESFVKSLELKSGNDTGFTKNVSGVDFSHFLEEHKNLDERAYEEWNNQFGHLMCLTLQLVLLWGGRNVGRVESLGSEPGLTLEQSELARQE